MALQNTGFNQNSGDREKQLSTVRIQLRSQRLSDNLEGMKQIKEWLRDNPEDQEVYGLLLNAVQKNHDLREQVRNLLIDMMKNGSKTAQDAISMLPSSKQDLLADADDAYYAAEYTLAIQLYRQVLKLDPDNSRAKDYLAKAKSGQPNSEILSSGLPRDAVQYFRRARSFMAGRDFLSAMKMLNAAIEAAQVRGMKYPDAEKLLNSVEDSLIAEEFRQKVYHLALEENQWQEALDLCINSLAPDLTDDVLRKEFHSIVDLLQAELEFRKTRVPLFAPIGRLTVALQSARVFLNPEDLLLGFIEKQLNRIRLFRLGSVILLSISIFFFSFGSRISNYLSTIAPISETPTIAPTISITASIVPNATATPTVTETATATVNPTVTSTETISPTPTFAIIGVGYITRASVSAWDEPNGRFVERLGLFQAITIFEQVDEFGSTWYRCTWEVDGIQKSGWILADYIQLGAALTLTP